MGGEQEACPVLYFEMLFQFFLDALDAFLVRQVIVYP